MRRAAVFLLALAACGGGDAKKAAPDAGVVASAGPVGPVTAVGADRVGGHALAAVDDVRTVIGTQALVDLAVEAAGYDGAMTTRGARLGRVPPGSIASRLGLVDGDVIAELAGTKVREVADLQDGWLALRRDGVVSAIVDRKGVRIERRLFLAEMLDDPDALKMPGEEIDLVRTDVVHALQTGVRPGDPVGEIDPKVIEALTTEGLLEASYRHSYQQPMGIRPEPGSPLTALGLGRWDVITAIGDRDVATVSSLLNELAVPRTELTLTILRVRDPIVLRFRITPGLVDQTKLDAALDAWKAREAQLAAERAAAQATAAALDTPAATDWDPYIKKIDDTHFEIKRKLLDLALADPSAVLARSARVVPAIKNNQPSGFKLYAIRPSSGFAKIGLHNGDTIHTINGAEIRSFDDVLNLSTKLARASKITLDVTRRGREVTLEYKIK